MDLGAVGSPSRLWVSGMGLGARRPGCGLAAAVDLRAVVVQVVCAPRSRAVRSGFRCGCGLQLWMGSRSSRAVNAVGCVLGSGVSLPGSNLGLGLGTTGAASGLRGPRGSTGSRGPNGDPGLRARRSEVEPVQRSPGLGRTAISGLGRTEARAGDGLGAGGTRARAPGCTAASPRDRATSARNRMCRRRFSLRCSKRG